MATEPIHKPDGVAESIDLTAVYQQVSSLLQETLVEFSGNCKERLREYLLTRNRHEAAIKQDLLPLLVYQAFGAQINKSAIALTATWTLHLAAAHMLDAVQDEGKVHLSNDVVFTLGVAATTLAQVTAESDTLTDILHAFGQITALGASAQSDERSQGKRWSIDGYFRNVAGKSASVIAVGIWIGGRLVGLDASLLTSLKEFGFALGMSLQLSDDYLDLADDLINGTYTLAMLEGLQTTEHEAYAQLQQLASQTTLNSKEVKIIIGILERMGALAKCQRVIRSYQVQVQTLFKVLPQLEPYFIEHVAIQ